MVIRQTLSLQMDDIGYVVALQCSSAAHAHHTLTKIYILAENRHVVLSQCAVILQISLIFFFFFHFLASNLQGFSENGGLHLIRDMQITVVKTKEINSLIF